MITLCLMNCPVHANAGRCSCTFRIEVTSFLSPLSIYLAILVSSFETSMPDQPIKHGRNLTVDSLRALDNGSKAAATRAQTALERVIEWRQDLSDVLDMFSRDSLKTNASSNVSDPMTGLVRKLNDVICKRCLHQPRCCRIDVTVLQLQATTNSNGC